MIAYPLILDCRWWASRLRLEPQVDMEVWKAELSFQLGKRPAQIFHPGIKTQRH